ncbi:MAG: MBL fold metallo-hydrolase [Anaerolineae bacterium]
MRKVVSVSTIRGLVLAAVLAGSLLASGCGAPAGDAPPTFTRSPAATRTLVATPLVGAMQAATPAITVRVPPALETATADTPAPEATGPPAGPTVEEVNVKIIVVYDNNAYAGSAVAGLRTDWGFACWVQAGDSTVLFDTGGNGAILLSNIIKLGLDPGQIDAIVLSHAHGDHTGGLMPLLDTGIRPVVYVPETFPVAFKDQVRTRTRLTEVGGPAEILPGVYTTGCVGTEIVEQALVVDTAEGLLVITGCAHPGIVNMVQRAREAAPGDVALVVGGYHLGSASQAEILRVSEGLRQLEVARVAPCHCSGDLARATFSEGWGAECLLPGVGWDLTIEPAG